MEASFTKSFAMALCAGPKCEIRLIRHMVLTPKSSDKTSQLTRAALKPRLRHIFSEVVVVRGQYVQSNQLGGIKVVVLGGDIQTSGARVSLADFRLEPKGPMAHTAERAIQSKEI